MGVTEASTLEIWRTKASGFVPPHDIECRDGQVAVLEYPARPSSAPKARTAVRGFLQSCEIRLERIAEILTAAGEAVANSIEHAYDPRLSGPMVVGLYCCPTHHRIVVEVRDQGRMQSRAEPPSGRGFGTLIIRALASQVSVDTTQGTSVMMLFRN